MIGITISHCRALLLILTLTPACARSSTMGYHVLELRTPAGAESNAAVLGSNLVVGGYFDRKGRSRACVWHGERGQTLPLPPQSSSSMATAVNSRGQIVGYCTFGKAGAVYPVLWHAGRWMRLPMLAGWMSAQPRVINNRGEILIQAQVSGGFRVFLWNRGHYSATPLSTGTALNDRDEMIAMGHGNRAFVASSNRVTQILLPPGHADEILAFSLNSRDQVAGGWIETAEIGRRRMRVEHAALWQSGIVHNLHPEGYLNSMANGINDHSDVVGLAGNRGPGSFIGVLWRRGVMQNLNRLIPRGSGWRILEASAINNNGVILAAGMHGGVLHDVLLVPTPLHVVGRQRGSNSTARLGSKML